MRYTQRVVGRDGVSLTEKGRYCDSGLADFWRDRLLLEAKGGGREGKKGREEGGIRRKYGCSKGGRSRRKRKMRTTMKMKKIQA